MLLFTFAFFDAVTILFLLMCIGEPTIQAKRLYAIVAGCAALAMLSLL